MTGRNVRYLCPQKICACDEAEKINIYFRVLEPELDVTLVARCGDATVAKKKEFRVNPGEMNHLTVDTSALTENEITVEVIRG